MTEPKIPPPHLRGKSLEGCNWDLEMAAGGGDVSQGAADGQSGWPNAHRSSQAPPRSTFEEGLTKPTAHLFVNSADFPVQLLWLRYDGSEESYAEVLPGHRHHQPTFSTHTWAIRRLQDGKFLGHHAGMDSEVTIRPEGVSTKRVTPLEVHSLRSWLPDNPTFLTSVIPPSMPSSHIVSATKVSYTHPIWGIYRRRGEAEGIPIMAFDVVSDDAVGIAARIVQRMLEHTADSIKRRMVEGNADVAIIGRDQVTTDIPAHQYLKGSRTLDGRCFDKSCRGLGGSTSIPTTSCGEENCTMHDDRYYPSESILVHEFAHAVMNIGMDEPEKDAVHQAYQAARRSALYDLGCYMMANADEYWAEGVQAWFHATERTDVNSGIKSRELLRSHDPKLAAIIERTFGAANKWRRVWGGGGNSPPVPGPNPHNRRGPSGQGSRHRRKAVPWSCDGHGGGKMLLHGCKDHQTAGAQAAVTPPAPEVIVPRCPVPAGMRRFQ